MDADAVLIRQAAAIEYQQKLDAEQREREARQAVSANVGSGGLGAPLPGQRPVASKSEATTAAAVVAHSTGSLDWWRWMPRRKPALNGP